MSNTWADLNNQELGEQEQGSQLIQQIEQLRKSIQYEEAMWQSAYDHPTDTHQFHKALADNRDRIDKMYDRLGELEKLSAPKDTTRKSE